MTQQSDKLIQELLQREDGSLDWGTVQSAVVDECGVMVQTAKKYIQDSDVCDVVVNANGDRMVVESSKASTETVLSNEEALEMEVGKRTRNKFSNLTVLEDNNHPLIPKSHKHGYIRRKVVGSKTDVSIVTATMSNEDFSTLLIGKHGIGKDKLVLHICANTNRPVIRPTFTSSSGDLVDLLIGHYTPDESGDFVFRKGLLTIAIENGYTFVADEINMIDGRIQTQMNDILEDSDQRQLTIPETNEIIQVHPEFIFVGTMNPPTMDYGGTAELNDAFASRFIPVKLPELDLSAEKRVVSLNSNTEADDSMLDRMLSEDGAIASLRSLHANGGIDMWISTRDMIKIAQMKDSLGDWKTACQLVLTGSVHPEKEEAIESVIDDAHW